MLANINNNFLSSTDRLRNFEKFKTDSLDLPYDYGSIMHFGMWVIILSLSIL